MYIVFDIGGTKTRVASSTDLLTYNEPVKFDTPLQYPNGLAALVSAIKDMADGAAITAMAGGIRGPLNADRTGIISESILSDWVGKDIVCDLRARCNTPCYLGNDSAMVGLGEAVYGAGTGKKIVAYLTVSTGVGGARYVNGVLDETMVNFEPGHQIVDIVRPAFGVDELVTLEDLVSGTALEKRRGCKPYDILQSDPVWDELAQYLAVGLHNLIMFWSPSIIVLGGSMIVGNPRILHKDIIRHTEATLNGFVPCPQIVDATLADEGGLYGALGYLKQRDV